MPLQTEMLQREIVTHTRVTDAKSGTVEYVASDESVDSYGEVVLARGADLSRMQKNAPFVDSHNYGSVDCLLGKVIDFQIEGKRLIETVQWAIDVPSNTLAIKGFQMTQAGYLKAVSIGFIPKEISRPNDPDWKTVCEDLGMGDLENSINCIYRKWLQLELSACCIGANENAITKSYDAGILDDSDLLRVPAWRCAMRSARPDPRRSYSFPSAPSTTKTEIQPMNDKTLIDAFSTFAKRSAPPTVNQTTENLEFARRRQSESEVIRLSMVARFAMARARRVTENERAQEILADPLLREFFNVLPRYACRVSCRMDMDFVRKALVPGSGLGATLLPIPVAEAIFDIIGINGAYKELGIVEMTSQETKIGQATANPTAIWITPTNQGVTVIPSDVALTGTSSTPTANTLGILLPVSLELLQDEQSHLAHYTLTALGRGLAGAIDYACFSAAGGNNQTDGSQTGMFLDGTIATVNAAQGNTTIAQLERQDFINCVAAVAPGALQRECKFYISSSLIAPLLGLVDVEGKSYLLQTPAATTDGTWRLVGFEVVWVAQAPAVTIPGSVIACFGHGPSYQVGMRSELEVALSDSTSGFSSNQKSFRALARAFCGIRAASGLAKLALAAA